MPIRVYFLLLVNMESHTGLGHVRELSDFILHQGSSVSPDRGTLSSCCFQLRGFANPRTEWRRSPATRDNTLNKGSQVTYAAP